MCIRDRCVYVCVLQDNRFYAMTQNDMQSLQSSGITPDYDVRDPRIEHKTDICSYQDVDTAADVQPLARAVQCSPHLCSQLL